MSSATIYQKIRDAVDVIRSRAPVQPQVGIILGSGLGAVADQLQGAVVIPYTEVPHFHGTSVEGMPPPEVKRGSDGELVIYDGVTRATRAAMYLPDTPITVEVTGQLKRPVAALPTVGEKV